MEAIVLAGGLGTRLSRVVPDLPKPMAPVAGRPFLSYLLERLADQGCSKICLSTGFRAEAIQDYFGEGFRGMNIVYTCESSPLGTGGAILNALQFTGSRDVFVLNGDTIAEVNFREMQAQHKEAGDSLTVALTSVPDAARYGTVTIHGRHIERFREKEVEGSGYINVGVYLLHRDLLQNMHLPSAFSFESDVLMKHLADIRPGAFLSSGYFIDIGIPEDYARAQHELAFAMSLGSGTIPEIPRNPCS